jgi:hypothetical protein
VKCSFFAAAYRAGIFDEKSCCTKTFDVLRVPSIVFDVSITAVNV